MKTAFEFVRILFLIVATFFVCSIWIWVAFESSRQEIPIRKFVKQKSSESFFDSSCCPERMIVRKTGGGLSKIMQAVIAVESGWRHDAVSRKGAIGLAQLMPETARELGVDPFDPEENILGGERYLDSQLLRFKNIRLALAAYNAGPTKVARLLARHGGSYERIKYKLPRETRNYVERVLETYSSLG